MIDHNKVVEILRTIKDPQSGRDIISAKMVENFQVDGNNITFSIVLKTNDSQLKSSLNFACMEALQQSYPDANICLLYTSRCV